MPVEKSTASVAGSRRELIQRSAMVSGTVRWTAPSIQSVAQPPSTAALPAEGKGVQLEVFAGGALVGHLVCDVAAETFFCLRCCEGIRAACDRCPAADPCAVDVVLVNCSPILPGPAGDGALTPEQPEVDVVLPDSVREELASRGLLPADITVAVLGPVNVRSSMVTFSVTPA